MKMGLCFAITMWVALVVLSGCASIRGAESGKGVEIDVYLIADEDINQDVLGVPSPVPRCTLHQPEASSN